MREPIWLRREWVDALQFQQLQRFGGLHGIREEGAIESALARPRNQWEYIEEREIATLAAAYGYGLTRNHGYSDGNKRIGFMAMAVFLDVNRFSLDAPEPDVIRIMLGVAAGEINEEDLAAWVKQNLSTSEDAQRCVAADMRRQAAARQQSCVGAACG